MNIRQIILNDLIRPNGQNQYTLNDDNQTFVTPGGQIVTLINAQLAAVNIREPDAGARQVYQYFKFIRDRAVLPLATMDDSKPLSTEQRREIIKECIASAFGTSLQPTTYEVLSDRICSDYPFYHRSNSSRYPAYIQQLSSDTLKDFVHMRIDAWKYEIVNHFNKEGEPPAFMEDLDSSLVEIILSMRLEAKAQELSLQKMFNAGKLKTVSGLLYRGGSLHEIDKAKQLKVGQPCFDIHSVNRSGAVYGRGLYVSPLPSVASGYSPPGTLGVTLEITVNQDSELMLFEGPDQNNSVTFIFNGMKSSSLPVPSIATCHQPNYLPGATVSFSFSTVPVAGGSVPNIKLNAGNGTVSFNQLSMSNGPSLFGPAQPSHVGPGPFTVPHTNNHPTLIGSSQPTHIGPGPFPVPHPNGQPSQQTSSTAIPNSRSSNQTDIVPTVNDVPHPLVGCIKCNNNTYLVVNPRFIKKIKVLDNELRTKVDLNFSPQEIVTHKLIPKLTPPPPLSQQNMQITAQLIDPLTAQSSNATIFLVDNRLPFSLASQRNRATELKFYSRLEQNQWIRVKPQFSPHSNSPTSNKPFVISYTRSTSTAKNAGPQ